MEKISVDKERFVDSLGRERIFNGVNMVDKRRYKTGNEVFAYEFNDEISDKLKRRGINVIRLGFTWSMIEPLPNEYNEKYLDSVEMAVKCCLEHGIYVYLDMHQDLYSSFGSDLHGDGAPKWACIYNENKYKLKPIKYTWDEKYWWDRAVQQSFDNFWINAEYQGRGLIDYFGDCWKHIADRFKNYDNLLGYDILNEPYPGTDGAKVFRKIAFTLVKTILFDKRTNTRKIIGDLIHKERRSSLADNFSAPVFFDIVNAAADIVRAFDVNSYQPFLKHVAAAIRKVDKDSIIMLENCYYSNLGIPCSAEKIETEGGIDKNQCFSPHGYDIMVDTDAYKYADSARIDGIFKEHGKTQLRLGLPVLVGEWGEFLTGGGAPCFEQTAFIADIFDKNKWSHTYWHYSSELLDSPVMQALSRPYPKAVSGEIIKYEVNRENRIFTLTCTAKGGEAIVFVPSKPVEVTKDGMECGFEYSGCDCKVKLKSGENKIVISF